MKEKKEKTEPIKMEIGSSTKTPHICAECQQQTDPQTEFSYTNNKKEIIYICVSCATKVNQRIEESNKNPNYFGAVILGLTAGAIGTVLWSLITLLIKREIGYLGIGLAYLIGYAIYFGAGKKRGKGLQWIGIITTVISLLAAELLIFIHLYFENLYKSLGKTGSTDLLTDIKGLAVLNGLANVLNGPKDLVFFLFYDNFKNYILDPILFLIWGFSLFSVWRILQPVSFIAHDGKKHKTNKQTIIFIIIIGAIIYFVLSYLFKINSRADKTIKSYKQENERVRSLSPAERKKEYIEKEFLPKITQEQQTKISQFIAQNPQFAQAKELTTLLYQYPFGFTLVEDENSDRYFSSLYDFSFVLPRLDKSKYKIYPIYPLYIGVLSPDTKFSIEKKLDIDDEVFDVFFIKDCENLNNLSDWAEKSHKDKLVIAPYYKLKVGPIKEKLYQFKEVISYQYQTENLRTKEPIINIDYYIRIGKNSFIISVIKLLDEQGKNVVKYEKTIQDIIKSFDPGTNTCNESYQDLTQEDVILFYSEKGPLYKTTTKKAPREEF